MEPLRCAGNGARAPGGGLPEVEVVRARIRSGVFRDTTSGLCPGLVQANFVALPARDAADFRLFCERNPRPCPLIEQTRPGDVAPPASAPGADLRTDIPRYRIYRCGELASQTTDVLAEWRDDLVSFLLGCSFTFERALVSAGIPVRHQEEGKVVPMYVTNRRCQAVGRFAAPLVVSMRPFDRRLLGRVQDITARFPLSHGAPVHTGDARDLGIDRLSSPDFGQPVRVRDDEVPVFWACGVTAILAAAAARPEVLITHAPGHMFVTDLDEAHHQRIGRSRSARRVTSW